MKTWKMLLFGIVRKGFDENCEILNILRSVRGFKTLFCKFATYKIDFPWTKALEFLEKFEFLTHSLVQSKSLSKFSTRRALLLTPSTVFKEFPFKNSYECRYLLKFSHKTSTISNQTRIEVNVLKSVSSNICQTFLHHFHDTLNNVEV